MDARVPPGALSQGRVHFFDIGDPANPVLLEAAIELEDKQQVRQLALAVERPAEITLLGVEVVEVHLSLAVGHAADGDHTRVGRGFDEIQQPAREGEVAACC